MARTHTRTRTPCVVILRFIGNCCAFVGRLRHTGRKLSASRIRPLFSPLIPPRPKVTGWLFREQMVTRFLLSLSLSFLLPPPRTSFSTHSLFFPPVLLSCFFFSSSCCGGAQERESRREQHRRHCERHKACGPALFLFKFPYASLHSFLCHPSPDTHRLGRSGCDPHVPSSGSHSVFLIFARWPFG